MFSANSPSISLPYSERLGLLDLDLLVLAYAELALILPIIIKFSIISNPLTSAKYATYTHHLLAPYQNRFTCLNQFTPQIDLILSSLFQNLDAWNALLATSRSLSSLPTFKRS